MSGSAIGGLCPRPFLRVPGHRRPHRGYEGYSMLPRPLCVTRRFLTGTLSIQIDKAAPGALKAIAAQSFGLYVLKDTLTLGFSGSGG